MVGNGIICGWQRANSLRVWKGVRKIVRVEGGDVPEVEALESCFLVNTYPLRAGTLTRKSRKTIRACLQTLLSLPTPDITLCRLPMPWSISLHFSIWEFRVVLIYISSHTGLFQYSHRLSCIEGLAPSQASSTV